MSFAILNTKQNKCRLADDYVENDIRNKTYIYSLIKKYSQMFNYILGSTSLLPTEQKW